MIKYMRIQLIKLIFIFFTISTVAQSQNYKSLGQYKLWSIFAKSNKELCYAVSDPFKSLGKYTKRGEVKLVVAYRPNEKNIGFIGFEFGYPFSKNAEVEIKIDDSKSFKLYTDKQQAWTYDISDDTDIINNMKKGLTMKVLGFSKKGTKTEDYYSLSGFTRAHNEILKACK